jgi:hypothetical protein
MLDRELASRYALTASARRGIVTLEIFKKFDC